MMYYLNMFDGRHCTKKDLDLLVNETNKVLSLIFKDIGDEQKKNGLNNFVNLIKRFDDQIAESLQIKIKYFDKDYSNIKRVIESHVEELKRNVVIDIYEHK